MVKMSAWGHVVLRGVRDGNYGCLVVPGVVRAPVGDLIRVGLQGVQG